MQNYTLIRNQTLRSAVLDYINSFPFYMKVVPKNISLSSVAVTRTTCSATISARSDDLKRRIELLEENITRINTELKQKDKEYSKKINEVITAVKIGEKDTVEQLEVVNNTIETLTVGSVQWEVWGILLVIYSAIINFKL